MDLKMCRICGGTEQLKNILDQDSEMNNKLLICVNINISPGDLLPKLICAQCEISLDISYCLRKTREATEKRLLLEIQQRKQKDDGSASVKEVNDSSSESVGGHSDSEKIDLSQCSESPKDSSENEGSYVKTISEHPQLTDTCEQDNVKIETLQVNDWDYEENNDACFTHTDFFINTSADYVNTLKEISQSSLVSEYCSINLTSSSESSANDCWDDSKKKQANATVKFNCDTCHEVFTKKNEYSLHIKQHGVQRYQCIQCCKFFPSRFRLKRHEEIHNEIPSHQCSYCNRNFRALYNLQRHVKSAHLGKKSLECNVCNINFSRIDILKRHLQLHSDEKKFICSICSQSFKTKDYLCAHQKYHHALTSERPKRNKCSKKDVNKYQCGYCGKLFKSSFSYKNHILIHTNEKPYKCDSCNKTFRTIAALTIHQRIHDDYRPYQCDLCLKSFRQAAHLKEHKLLHLNNVPMHVCSICQASFAKKSNLKAHIQTHAKQKLFKCADCSAEFSYMHLLQQHASKVHFRSVYKVYTLNDIEETLEADDEIQSNVNLETEMCHYIDTVGDDDDDELDNNVANFVDLVANDQNIIDRSSHELQIINKPQLEHHMLNDNNSVSPVSTPIMDYVEMHSINAIQCPPFNEDIAFQSNDDDNHTEEQKVDHIVTEEIKLASSVYNVYELE